jgi:hypothetical protein
LVLCDRSFLKVPAPSKAHIYSPAGPVNPAYALFLPGNGDGTFGAAVPVTLVQPTGASTLQAVDLNGDGITDLIAFGASFLGSANGSFTLLQILPADGWAEDLNGDGKLELVSFGSNADIYTLNIYTGNPDGSFSGTPQSSTASVTGQFDTSAVGDVNGDGLADIAVLSTYGMSVYLNQGNGTLTQDPTQYFAGSSNQGPAGSSVGLSGSPLGISLARLNSASAASGAQRTLDALDYTSGGVTSITTESSVTINATLFATGSTAPTGSVTFYAGATQIGTSTITNGAASTTAPISGSGNVVIRAVYSGDTNFASATGFASLTVQAPVSTTTTLTGSATSINEQQQFILTATVQGNSRPAR